MLKIVKITLPKEFHQKANASALAQAIRVYTDRSHLGLAKVKTRSEVNKTTKKLYKQKGTGGARHGSKSAHIFVGGGVAHGPKGIKRVLKLTDSLRKKALGLALSSKAKDEKVLVVSGFSTVKKTKEISDFLGKIKEKRFLIALNSENIDRAKFVRNIKNVRVVNYRDLNAYNVLFGGTLVLDSDIFEVKKEKKEKAK
ncbi:MAG: 50S ribosomal protein L4 [Patescibacteria group bacterium]